MSEDKVIQGIQWFINDTYPKEIGKALNSIGYKIKVSKFKNTGQTDGTKISYYGCIFIVNDYRIFSEFIFTGGLFFRFAGLSDSEELFKLIQDDNTESLEYYYIDSDSSEILVANESQMSGFVPTTDALFKRIDSTNGDIFRWF